MTPEDYTPTTEEVFKCFADMDDGWDYPENESLSRDTFNRWLAEERAKVWDEAIAAQQEVDLDWESYIMSNDNRMKPPKIAENPYRAA